APRARPERGFCVGVETLFLEVACARRRRDGPYLTPVSATWHGITFPVKDSALAVSGLARPMIPLLDVGRGTCPQRASISTGRTPRQCAFGARPRQGRPGPVRGLRTAAEAQRGVLGGAAFPAEDLVC